MLVIFIILTKTIIFETHFNKNIFNKKTKGLVLKQTNLTSLLFVRNILLNYLLKKSKYKWFAYK